MNKVLNLIKKLLVFFRFPIKKETDEIVFPQIMERKMGEQTARFEAVVSDDPVRISDLCGEETWWQDIVNMLEPIDCFWDIGSFTGLLTVYTAKKCSAGTVVAIEPDPDFMTRVTRNMELNNVQNVRTFNLGFSDVPGTLKLNTSGVEGWSPSFFQKELREWIEVPVTTMDLLCKQYPELSPNIIKIDVEGFEGKVLAGARAVLASPKLRAIFLELHPEFLVKNGQSIGKVLSLLEDNGFVLKEFRQRNAEIHVLALKQKV